MEMMRGAIILLSILHLISAQQVFETKGDNYDAKVTIHRNRAHLPANPHPPAPHPGGHQQQPQPWEQGDRITKQEIIQNLAKELLSRKKTEEERREQSRKTNAEKLEEYYAIQMKRNQMEAMEREREERAWNSQNQPQPQPQPLPNQGPRFQQQPPPYPNQGPQRQPQPQPGPYQESQPGMAPPQRGREGPRRPGPMHPPNKNNEGPGWTREFMPKTRQRRFKNYFRRL